MMATREIPKVAFHDLETLWVQISGTLCNLRCTHCFISCAPDNHDLPMMQTEKIIGYLKEAEQLGVKDIYFTGGEPFLHKDFLSILELTLQKFPASILTNGLLINEDRADKLARIAQHSHYSLEIRVSLDDYEETRNDSVRGLGTYRKVLAAYKRLWERGLLPILAVTEIREYHSPDDSPLNAFEKYVELLGSFGVLRPRIKIIPVLEMGMLPIPDSPRYVTPQMMMGFDHSLLQCSTSRIVADDGIYSCPILVNEEQALIGDSTLSESLVDCDLYHTACTTCYTTGMTCKNY
jgi:sulfatase maturation enzyme AslB (radical SAM superfamily)